MIGCIQERSMRHSRIRSTMFLVAAFALATPVGRLPGLAQTDPAAAPPPTSALGPYQAVPITLPPPMNDASFEAFRKRLAEVAQRKDRGALA
jgi:hypothetical protein